MKNNKNIIILMAIILVTGITVLSCGRNELIGTWRNVRGYIIFEKDTVNWNGDRYTYIIREDNRMRLDNVERYMEIDYFIEDNMLHITRLGERETYYKSNN